ncbi:MAG: hypothetical protein GY875_18490 [Gammaproteobacteria bacterium]|nr:hypothetical protein [Gammaproteobacteria bacterium]
MKHLLLMLGLLSQSWCLAAESTVTVPWDSFDNIYRDQIKQQFEKVESPPTPIINLDQIRYDLSLVDRYATGTVTMEGQVRDGDPESLRFFGQKIAVTEVVETRNATLIASDGSYRLDTLEAGSFLVVFKVSIPILDYQVNPRLEFDVPVAVRNELVIDSPDHLRLGNNGNLHKIGERYFFPPTSNLIIGFEHVEQQIDGLSAGDKLMAQVETPEVVLDTVSFFVSFTEDGSVLSAMSLVLPPNSRSQLELDPIDGAEVWSLQVNGKPRSLYSSPEQKWIVPLESNVDSQITLAYLTRGSKLGLQGRLDFNIPETGLTARRVELTVGLPKRMQMLAMDSDLQPDQGRDRPLFDSFSGRPHYFSKPFYRGHALASSIIYQEPVNHDGSKQ